VVILPGLGRQEDHKFETNKDHTASFRPVWSMSLSQNKPGRIEKDDPDRRKSVMLTKAKKHISRKRDQPGVVMYTAIPATQNAEIRRIVAGGQSAEGKLAGPHLNKLMW
jgi:hypothetical protein